MSGFAIKIERFENSLDLAFIHTIEDIIA